MVRLMGSSDSETQTKEKTHQHSSISEILRIHSKKKRKENVYQILTKDVNNIIKHKQNLVYGLNFHYLICFG